MVFYFSATANATLITFDDLSVPVPVAIAEGYQGMNWSNFYVMDAATFNASGFFSSSGTSGYKNGMVSAPNVAYSGSGNPATISSANAFNFNSVYLTAAWYDGLNVNVTGSLAGNIVDTANFTVNTSGPTLETFNWTDINSVTFTTSGGTLHQSAPLGAGRQLVFDNLTISSIPVPSAAWLFGSTFIGFWLVQAAKSRYSY